MSVAPTLATEAPRDCALCPRLVDYRQRIRQQQPGWFNAPVPSFGDQAARLAIIGLAPGVGGANRTGRPFTGDYAGELLYATLTQFGWANGAFDGRVDDGLVLRDCLITNAVRCVPPENKPTGAEVNACRPYLTARLAALPQLRAVVCLGKVAHDSLLRALGARLADFPFTHGARYQYGKLSIFDSYHCSRYNTNTGRLTPAMFQSVFAAVRQHLDMLSS